MTTVEEHLSCIGGTVCRLPPIDLSLIDAQGCVLAQDVTSEVALPGFITDVHVTAKSGGRQGTG